MNKLASILAALILTASVVGCSDEKSPDNSAVKADNSSNVAQNTDPKKEDESASSFKKNFISSCILGSGVTDDALIPQITEVCSCTYDNIIKDYGMTEFIRVDMEMRKDGSKSLPKEWNIDKIVEQCISTITK